MSEQPQTQFVVGAVIKERQHNGYPRQIVISVPGHYVITLRAGRKTRIAWRNLGRYEIVSPAPDLPLEDLLP